MIQAGESITVTITSILFTGLIWVSDISTMDPDSGEYPPTIKEKQDNVNMDS